MPKFARTVFRSARSTALSQLASPSRLRPGSTGRSSRTRVQVGQVDGVVAVHIAGDEPAERDDLAIHGERGGFADGDPCVVDLLADVGRGVGIAQELDVVLRGGLVVDGDFGFDRAAGMQKGVSSQCWPSS